MDWPSFQFLQSKSPFGFKAQHWEIEVDIWTRAAVDYKEPLGSMSWNPAQRWGLSHSNPAQDGKKPIKQQWSETNRTADGKKWKENRNSKRIKHIVQLKGLFGSFSSI